MSCHYAEKVLQATHSLIYKRLSVHQVLHVRIILRQRRYCITFVVRICAKAVVKLFEVVKSAFDFVRFVFGLKTFQIGPHFDVVEPRRLKH